MLSAALTQCGNTRSGCKYHARPPRFSAVMLISISWHVPRRSEWSWGHPGARSFFAVCRLEGPNYGEANRCGSSRSSKEPGRALLPVHGNRRLHPATEPACSMSDRTLLPCRLGPVWGYPGRRRRRNCFGAIGTRMLLMRTRT